MAPGTVGENLTVEGIDLGALVIGTRWLVGTTELEVSQPRQPCFKLGLRMGDAEFVDRFAETARFGASLRIVREGDVGVGDDVTVLARPEGITVVELGTMARDADVAFLERIIGDPAVPAAWHDWARRRRA
jgi:MOSC domain-containing protein YiiM